MLEQWLGAKEGEHFEFKEARSEYSFDKLVTYCCALANEGGGRIILGVSDKRPRKVVGSQAFPQPEEVRRSLSEKLRLLIDFQEIAHPNGRVLVFETPPRPIGIPIKYDGVYWSRENDSLVPINEERLRDIFNESGHDFSADICPSITSADLEQSAIEDFRKRWIAKSGNETLNRLAPEQLLRDVEAVADNGVTFAALVLFGTR